MNKQTALSFINNSVNPEKLKEIAVKVIDNIRITAEEGILLYKTADLAYLSFLSNYVNEQKNSTNVYYVKNIHLEPSNICIHKCNFCSFRKNEENGYSLSLNEIEEKLIDISRNKNISEIHIVGSVNPNKGLEYYSGIIEITRKILPDIHIKAYSAVEIDDMISGSNLTLEEGLLLLKSKGLDSIPGGGAEILDDRIREKICNDKTNSEKWLKIHETAHNIGIYSNSTMLYGHIESYEDRINHLNKLRELQDKTNKFLSFIPLKFRNKNNSMSNIEEVSLIEDLRNYAISRIFLDNFNNIKAYWPMIGKSTTQTSLAFGVNDIDGTINDSTTIYTEAGVNNFDLTMTEQQMIELIKNAKKNPVLRNSVYKEI